MIGLWNLTPSLEGMSNSHHYQKSRKVINNKRKYRVDLHIELLWTQIKQALVVRDKQIQADGV